MEFNKDGSLKLPKKVAEFKAGLKQKEETAQASGNKILMEFKGIEDNYECSWDIQLPDSISAKELFKIKKWTDANINLVKSWIEKGAQNYTLKIRGHKNRCIWCRSFRTALKTHMLDLTCTVKQTNRCEYEK